MKKKNDALVVVWSDDNKTTAIELVFRYAKNAKLKEWFKDVTFIVWGASAKALPGDKDLEEGIKALKDAGVVVEACKACSDSLGVSDKLEAMGINVRYVGESLSNYLKEGRNVITF